MRALWLGILAACGVMEPGGSTDGLDDSFGEVSGAWEVGSERVDFVGGIAYGGAFSFDGRAVLALTTWDDPHCAGGPEDWLGAQEGYKLEVPFDQGSGTEDAKLFACEALEGTGFSCASVAFPRARLAIDALGLERGEPVSGSLELLDDRGATEATVRFDVVYCGED